VIKQPRLQFESGATDANSLYDLQLELRVLGDARIRAHDNIVKLQTVIWEENSDVLGRYWPSLVMEDADLGTLSDFYSRGQRPASTRAELKLCYDVGSALHFLHQEGVVHRDVKPENILMFTGDSENEVVPKIGDFGYALIDGQPLKAAGTEMWKAPEVLSEQVSKDNVIESDVYSYGLLVWYIAKEGEDLFTSDTLSYSTDDAKQDKVRQMKLDGAVDIRASSSVSDERSGYTKVFQLTLQLEPHSRDLARALEALRELIDPSEPALRPSVPSKQNLYRRTFASDVSILQAVVTPEHA
jgi:serine/threonine protein kinase